MFQGWFIGIAALGAAIAASLWFVMLRPAPIQERDGVLVAKQFEAAHTVIRQPTGSPGGAMPPRQDIHYSDRYLLNIQLDDGTKVMAVVPELTGEKLKPGDAMRVKYQLRGIPPLWRKIIVLEATPAGR